MGAKGERRGSAATRQGPGESLSERFYRCRTARPDQVVVIDGPVQLTAGRLVGLGDRLAGSLRRHGVGEGDVLSLQLPNWWEAVVIGCAAFRLGATLCPLPPNLPLPDLAAILARAKVRAFFCTGDGGPSQVGRDAGAVSISTRSVLVDTPAFDDLVSSGGALPLPRRRRRSARPFVVHVRYRRPPKRGSPRPGRAPLQDRRPQPGP